MAVLGQFGVQTTSLIALLGAAGLAIGLALQGTLSNVASGVMLLLLRPYRVGEKITAGAVSGTVQEIGLFHTEIVTYDGLFVAMPNSVIFSGTIVNLTREPTPAHQFPGRYRPRCRYRRVRRRAMLDAVGTRQPCAEAAAAAGLGGRQLSGPQVVLNVHAWVSSIDFMPVQSEIKLWCAGP